MVAELAPVRKPADYAVLHVAVGMERRGQLAQRRPALFLLPHQPADRALGELLEVVLDVADRAVDRARQRVVGWFAYWCQFGNHLAERMIDCIEPDAPSFNVISL